MARIFIDNTPYEVKEGKNLLEACLQLGLDLPYFCWHPSLGSVGACRQCAIKSFKDEDDKKGRIVMSCMEPVRDNMRISVNDSEATSFREHVIGWLMTNHPHDCAVCDEGGSCHLQDMTVMTGHSYRDYRFTKRTYHNQDLGPFLNHEMNRCIQCYRCVRFYKDYAGGKDLNVFAAHNHVYFGRQQNGTLESEFSGNLAEVCPTGVFTDKTLKSHYTRKWDMTYAPSVCQGCSLGCNISAGERYGSLRQIVNRYNGEVNGYFLCDRGRYGYEFVNSSQRIVHPAIRPHHNGSASREYIIGEVAARLKNGKAIGIGSPRASLESNFTLRQLVGAEHFYLGMSDTDHDHTSLALKILHGGPVRTPSLHEAETADMVLILGEDLTNTAPMLALAVRQAVRQVPMNEAMQQVHLAAWQDAAVREAMQEAKGPLFILHTFPTSLDELATGIHRDAPDNLARIAFAISRALGAPVNGSLELGETEQALVNDITAALKAAKRPLIIAGYGTGCDHMMKAAANISWALLQGGGQPMLSLTLPECNSLGLEMLGGHRFDSALAALKNGEADTLVVLENDLYRRADKHVIDELFSYAKDVILVDHLYNQTAENATVLLPAGTFAEADGTIVNNEGRAQRYYQVYVPKGEVQESWKWFLQIGEKAGVQRLHGLHNLDDVVWAMTTAIPALAPIAKLAPNADFRMAGQKIPREPHRYSGRTAMLANESVNEPRPPEDEDTPLSFTMEGYRGEAPAPLIPFFWAPGWNSPQAVNKFQSEIGGHLHGGDPGKRLLEPHVNGSIPFFTEVPQPYLSMPGHLHVMPLYSIFGSEELSMYTKGIAQRAQDFFVIYMNPEDIDEWNITPGIWVNFHIEGHAYLMVAVPNHWLPRGIAAMNAGLPKSQIIDLPQCIRFSGSEVTSTF
ncbi:NADH-quinone oxidoreductase subunit NuoG [Chitinophaga alhagiae]|uniref:NADH-quinone oxidoreductase subunit NuoG n=1 Tax=Chitinophaga alhagiae TaxID=2203219 RepID=UPI000E5BBC6A|nr:NADH-quinone oxidoreductase subunit NuoG [Chitinophaga alhagiae]